MPPIRGRGTPDQPSNRFERAAHVADPDIAPPADLDPDGAPARRVALTEFIADATRNILTRNTSPDVPFNYSVNPYRGCEHGWPCWSIPPGRNEASLPDIFGNCSEAHLYVQSSRVLWPSEFGRPL